MTAPKKLEEREKREILAPTKGPIAPPPLPRKDREKGKRMNEEERKRIREGEALYIFKRLSVASRNLKPP